MVRFPISVAVLFVLFENATPFSLSGAQGTASKRFQLYDLKSNRLTLDLLEQCKWRRCYARQATALFFNDNSEDDHSSSNHSDGDYVARTMRQATHTDTFDIEGDEQPEKLVYADESPQDKILRLRSGKLTSYEKKAFLESTLNGNRSIRAPVVKRKSSTLASRDRSVLSLGQNAKAERENEEYVSRVLDPSRFGLQLARQQTANATIDDFNVTQQQLVNYSIDDANATDSMARAEQETSEKAKPKKKSKKALKKYFSSSRAAQKQSKKDVTLRADDSTNEKGIGITSVTIESDQGRSRRAIKSDGKTDVPILSKEEEEKSKRWGVDIDKLKLSDD